jgi:hypothetical protein
MFDVEPQTVTKRLQVLVRDGRLACTPGGKGRGRSSIYTAGPVLLEEIGLNHRPLLPPRVER